MERCLRLTGERLKLSYCNCRNFTLYIGVLGHVISELREAVADKRFSNRGQRSRIRDCTNRFLAMYLRNLPRLEFCYERYIKEVNV